MRRGGGDSAERNDIITNYRHLPPSLCHSALLGRLQPAVAAAFHAKMDERA